MARVARKQSASAPDLGQIIPSMYFDDPLGFVMFSFPWGQPGTPLHDETGPDVWQAKFLQILSREVRKRKAGGGGEMDLQTAIQIAVASGHGVGKQLGLETIVPTPSGNRRWGDLLAGDMVFGRNGVPTRILQCHYPPAEMFYRVVFDDGSEVVAGHSHQWAVRGRQERRKGLAGYRVMTTGQILEAGVRRSNGGAMARQWEIPKQGIVHFDAREIDLHPYFVGLWIGDGTRGEPSYCKPHDEIRDRLAEVADYEVTTRADGKQRRVCGINHLFDDPVFQTHSCDRYIPDDYKFNTAENRLELFRGLMDSDGEVHGSGSIGYSTTSRRLADDVVWLARSLGCKAKLQDAVKDGWYPDGVGARVQCRPCWRITINCPLNPFTHAERRAAFKPSEPRYTVRWIDRIEPVGEQKGMCISVEAEDELYLANDFVVTHNTTVIAWLILWFMSTRVQVQITVTANTAAQLSTKTWRELAKWHRLAINRDWFTWTATKFYRTTQPETWFATAQPWSEQRSEAIQGAHEREVMILFDEASAIPDGIWEAIQGSMTTHGAIWIAFGNPTQPVGRFRECFRKFRRRWITFHVDGREAKKTNKAELRAWIEDYGEDSDFARVRVRGQFPRVGGEQFIGLELVEKAMGREVEVADTQARILSVDVARFGDDQTVIGLRQGKRFQVVAKHRELDTEQVAFRVHQAIKQIEPDAVMVDEVGVGGGVVDILVGTLGHSEIVVPVNGAMKPLEPRTYFNRRAEMYGRLRDWLRQGGAIPDDTELRDELTAPVYGFAAKDQIQLENKADLKSRIGISPDTADCLAMTFFDDVAPRRVQERLAGMMDDDSPLQGSWMAY